MGDILEFKVIFEADGVTANNMLLTRVDHDLYSVEQTLVLVDCVSYKDIIEADLQPDGSLMFLRVVKKSEMQTYSFVLAKKVIDSVGREWEKPVCSKSVTCPSPKPHPDAKCLALVLYNSS